MGERKIERKWHILQGDAPNFLSAFQAEPLQGAAPLVSSSCSCCASYLPQAGSVDHADTLAASRVLVRKVRDIFANSASEACVDLLLRRDPGSLRVGKSKAEENGAFAFRSTEKGLST